MNWVQPGKSLGSELKANWYFGNTRYANDETYWKIKKYINYSVFSAKFTWLKVNKSYSHTINDSGKEKYCKIIWSISNHLVCAESGRHPVEKPKIMRQKINVKKEKSTVTFAHEGQHTKFAQTVLILSFPKCECLTLQYYCFSWQ